MTGREKSMALRQVSISNTEGMNGRERGPQVNQDIKMQRYGGPERKCKSIAAKNSSESLQ